MALTTMELFTAPAEIERATAEFAKRIGGFQYIPKVGDRKPPLDYRR
jgi:aminobenzoyl-glutamate utilization protein B